MTFKVIRGQGQCHVRLKISKMTIFKIYLLRHFQPIKKTLTVSDTIDQTRDYFDATASNWNTSAHSAPWRVSLYKDWQSNQRVGFSGFDLVIRGGQK